MDCSISIRNLIKDFGTSRVLKGLDLEIPAGRFITLLGPSGCGKTTLLRSIAGISDPTSGEIWLGDRRLDGVAPEKRNFGMVFQTYALFPHMSIEKNVAFGLEMRRTPKADIVRRVAAALDLVGLGAHARRLPRQLSGGQQQRVALARAIVIEPDVLLFDEPLSNLDAKLRVTMRTEIRRIQQKLGITAVYVTHDQSEAMSLSDQIIIMNKGVVAQMGTPMQIYYHPNSEFVADFIGEANFLDGVVESVSGDRCTVSIAGHPVTVLNPNGFAPGQACKLVLRPEAAVIGKEGSLPCIVALSTFMGAYQYYQVMVGDTLVKINDTCPVNKHIFQVGDQAFLSFGEDAVHLL